MSHAPHVLIGDDHDDPGGMQHLRHRHEPRDDVFGTFEEAPGLRYMYRPHEVLVASEDNGRVAELLHAADATMVEEDDVLELQKWRLRREDGVRHLVSQCRAMSELFLPAVSANTALGLGGHIWVGCASVPAHAEPLEPPPFPVGTGPGAGVRVGLIDTGVNNEPAWLNDRCERRGRQDIEVASVAGREQIDEAAGHGTFAAGLILQKAPGATVVVRRKVTAGGIIDDWTLARAILELGSASGDASVHLIHLSLGGFTADNAGLLATGRALRKLSEINPDLVVVASSGNDGVDRPYFPAAFNGVVGVGALEGTTRPASFTNRGHWVDACANGVDVVSAYFTGNFIPPMSTTRESFQGAASWSGSSHSAAQVTGAIAARMRPPDGTPISARQAVFELVTSADADRRVSDLGTRIV